MGMPTDGCVILVGGVWGRRAGRSAAAELNLMRTTPEMLMPCRPDTPIAALRRAVRGLWLAALVAVAPSSAASDAAPGYVLQPGDVIAISVLQDPGLERAVLVRPDGGISVPLAGEIEAAGRTIAELRSDVAEALATAIPDPFVTVSLQGNEGNRIYITGRVHRPGVFPMIRPVDVMQAIALAGGLTPFADKDGIRILRREGGELRSIPFDYKAIQKGRDLEQNILLQAGDTLVVP